MSLKRQLAAEALGTGLLIAGVVGSGIMAESLSGGNIGLALLANTVATGALLVVLISMFGPISGAHFNPAVSLVMMVRGALPWRHLPLFIGAQIAGGALGTLLTHAMFDLPLLQIAVKARSGSGQWLSEGVATFGLVLAILRCMDRPAIVPAMVGLYITAAYWFTASTSFANPAVTVARALTDSFAGIQPAHVPAFIAAQLLGAALAALTERFVFAPKTPA